MEGVSDSLIEVTHGPLDPLETKVDQVMYDLFLTKQFVTKRVLRIS